MTDDEIRTEIARQIHDKLELVVTALREQATHGSPMSKKILLRAVDAIEKVRDGQ